MFSSFLHYDRADYYFNQSSCPAPAGSYHDAPAHSCKHTPGNQKLPAGHFIRTFFTFLYNYFSSLLRALGNSLVPLLFLALSALMNIALDLLFVISFGMGIAGAAWATIISQAFSALLLAVYTIRRLSLHRIRPKTLHFDRLLLKELLQYSLLTSVQQSVMNFGILMVQGLVNSFGVTVMAAFAAAVKIDSFAYMPVQDFGNGFSTFIAQNLGAGKTDRIQKGIRSAFLCSFLFCLFISAVVLLFAERLMLIFIRPEELEIITIGAGYLRIEGACYFAIGFLFLFYGLYRGLGRPGISVVLTVISLGNPCSSFLHARTNSGLRDFRYLVVHPYRLVPGGCRGGVGFSSLIRKRL